MCGQYREQASCTRKRFILFIYQLQDDKYACVIVVVCLGINIGVETQITIYFVGTVATVYRPDKLCMTRTVSACLRYQINTKSPVIPNCILFPGDFFFFFKSCILLASKMLPFIHNLHLFRSTQIDKCTEKGFVRIKSRTEQTQ